MSEVEAGWYPDPADPERARFWAGDEWTERTVTLAELLAPTAPAKQPVPIDAPSEVSGAPSVASDERAEEVLEPEPALSATTQEEPVVRAEPEPVATAAAQPPSEQSVANGPTSHAANAVAQQEVGEEQNEPIAAVNDPDLLTQSVPAATSGDNWFWREGSTPTALESPDWWSIPAVPSIPANEEGLAAVSEGAPQAPVDDAIAQPDRLAEVTDEAESSGASDLVWAAEPANPVPAPPSGWARAAEPSPYLPGRDTPAQKNGVARAEVLTQTATAWAPATVDGWWKPAPVDPKLPSSGGAAASSFGPSVLWASEQAPTSTPTVGRPQDSWFPPVHDALELPDRLWEAVRPISQPGTDNGHTNGIAARPAPSTVVHQVVVTRTDWSPDGAWFTIFGGLLIAIGTFVPWLMANTTGASFTRDAYQLGAQAKLTFDGPLCVLLGAATVGLGILRLVRHDLPGLIRRASLLTGLVVGLLLADRWSGTHALVSQLNSHGPVIAIVGYGYWMCAGGAILAFLGGLVANGTRAAPAQGG